MMPNKDIPSFARQIAETYGGYPLSVTALAKNAGIKVIENRHVNDLLPGEHGKVYYDGEDWIIIFDETRTTEQMRFTVAHELGHCFLKHNEEHRAFLAHIEKLKDKHGRRVDRQADLFARCLLSSRGTKERI